ncbi:MAG: hypothetical protein ABIZ56_06165 [Chthoniobacteraceae bacterium]
MTDRPSTRILLAVVAVAFSAILHAAEPAKSALQRAQELAVSGDVKGAVELLKTEAGKGSAEAANAVGELHLVGQGVKASTAEAARWFQQAADASYPPGMVNLGMLLIKGAEGVPADPDKGQFLIRSAAEEGFAPAQVAMGKQAEKNGQDGGEPAEARAWFEKAAAQENADGLLAMARFHDLGIAGPRDPAKGFEACRRAARAGSALAMNEVGVRYQKGQGVAAEPTNAIGWFTVAAQRGLPAAQVNLGNCFEIGNGVLQDLSLAGTHYAAAAKQQFGPAQYLLAQLYESGRGTAANPVYAFVYYTLAAKNGTEAAAKKAADLKGKLTDEQMKEAEKMIADGGKPPVPETAGKK